MPRGVETPLAFTFSRSAIHADTVAGAAEMPALESRSEFVQTMLARWMSHGTPYTWPPTVMRSSSVCGYTEEPPSAFMMSSTGSICSLSM